MQADGLFNNDVVSLLTCGSQICNIFKMWLSGIIVILCVDNFKMCHSRCVCVIIERGCSQEHNLFRKDDGQ